MFFFTGLCFCLIPSSSSGWLSLKKFLLYIQRGWNQWVSKCYPSKSDLPLHMGHPLKIIFYFDCFPTLWLCSAQAMSTWSTNSRGCEAWWLGLVWRQFSREYCWVALLTQMVIIVSDCGSTSTKWIWFEICKLHCLGELMLYDAAADLVIMTTRHWHQ